MNILAMIGCVVIILISGWSYFVPADAIGLVGSYAGALLVVFSYLFLKYWTKSKIVPLDQIDLDTGVRYYSIEELEAEKLEKSQVKFWQKVKQALT